MTDKDKAKLKRDVASEVKRIIEETLEDVPEGEHRGTIRLDVDLEYGTVSVADYF